MVLGAAPLGNAKRLSSSALLKGCIQGLLWGFPSLLPRQTELALCFQQRTQECEQVWWVELKQFGSGPNNADLPFYFGKVTSGVS